MNLNERVKASFELPPLTDAEIDRLIVDAKDRAQAALPTRSGKRRRYVSSFAAAAAVALTLSGVALAKNGNLHFWKAGTPADRIVEFQARSGAVTVSEYRDLVALTMVPGASGELVPKYPLAPRSSAQVLVDDPIVGRVIAVPTADGSSICMFRADEQNGSGSVGGCDSDFNSLGVMASYQLRFRPGRPASWEVSGIAADDVSEIEVVLSDGRRRNVPLEGNAFRWVGSSEDEAPVRLRTVRSGQSGEADIPSLG